MKALLTLGLLIFAVVSGEGRIQGHVHYPACFGPPEDFEVCAERSDGLRRCTSKLAFTDAGFAYTLHVPPGSYLVYSVTETYFPGYRAHYSAAVRCGLSIECQDHEPIEVRVRAGETVRGVDPDDWFAPIEAPSMEPTA